MSDTQKSGRLRLLLDNGGMLERRHEPGRHGELDQHISFAQRIALGELSFQQQSKQLDEIASVYNRVYQQSENEMPRPKRVVAPVRSTL